MTERPLGMDSADTPAEAQLCAAVRGYRTRSAWLGFAGGVLLAGLLSAAVLLGLVVADHLRTGGLPTAVLRLAGYGWLVLLGGGVLLAAGMSLRHRLGALYIARELERRTGIPHNTVVNALLIRRSGASYAADAAAVRAAADLRHYADAETSESPFGGRMLGVLAGLTVAAWVTYALLSPKPIPPSLGRLFGSLEPAPTATRLELVYPGPGEVVHAQQPLKLELRVTGRPADEVVLELCEPDAPATARRMTVLTAPADDGNGRWASVQLAPVDVRPGLWLHATANDAVLRQPLPIVAAPQPEALTIVLEPPAYTRQPPRPSPTLDFTALAGTRATFTLQANAPLRNPVLVFAGERETRTRMRTADETAQTATLALVLTESGHYTVEFADPWDGAYRNAPPHEIEVVADTPPTIELLAPTAEQVPDDNIDVGRFPKLLVAAEDDVGVLTFALVREDDDTHTPLLDPNAAFATRVVREVAAAELVPTPGTRVTVHFVAQDGFTTPDGAAQPHGVQSRSYTLLRAAEPLALPSTGDDETESPGDASAADGDDEGTEQDAAATPDHAGADANGQSTDTTSTEPAADGADGGGEQLDRELDRLVEEHGDEVERLRRRLNEPGAGDESDDSAADNSDAGNDGNQPAENGEASTEPDSQSSPTADSNPAGESNDPNDANHTPGETPPETEPATTQPTEGEAEPQATTQPAESDETAVPAGESNSTSAAGADGQSDAEGEAQASSASSGGEPSGEEEGVDPNAAAEPSETSGNDAEEPERGSQASGRSESGNEEAADGTDPQQERRGGAENEDPPGVDASSSAANAPTERTSNPNRDGAAEEPDDPNATPAEVESPEQPPTGAAGLDSAGRAEVLDLLRKLERSDELTAEQLEAWGWTPTAARDFLVALQRARAAAREADATHARELSFDTRVGDLTVNAGAAGGAEVETNVTTDGDPRPALERVTPPQEQQVPAHLRGLLEAYYRALAKQADTQAHAE